MSHARARVHPPPPPQPVSCGTWLVWHVARVAHVARVGTWLVGTWLVGTWLVGTWLVWHTWLVWARGSWGVGRVQKMFVDFSKSRARGVCTLLRGETVWE